jgi:hypothetical protein
MDSLPETLPVFSWPHSRLHFKEIGKMTAVLETALQTDLGNR